MKIATIRLKEYFNQASDTEKGIIKFILSHPEETARMTIHSLAEKTFSSASSIIRMCKKNGFDGYKDFTKALIYELAARKNHQAKVKGVINKADSIRDIVDKVTNMNILSLEDTRNLIDFEVLNECLRLIDESENLCLFGIGSSLLVARDAQLKFLRVKKKSYVSDDWHSQLLTAKNMTPRDVGIVISYSGQTHEMIECAKAMKESGANTISITRYAANPIKALCDYNLYVAANEALFRSGAMSSRMSQLNIIDILYTAYTNRQYDESLELLVKTHIRKETKGD
ncbi:MurR/RpiR family transcriptional regulator [Alkaliphilus crotonatoxidans]